MALHHSKIKIFFFLLLIAIPLNLLAKAEKTISADKLNDKMRGMWLGQLIGNYAGRPTEGDFSSWYPDPNLTLSWEKVIRFSNDPNNTNNPNWVADDDTDIEYIAMHILEANGFDCNSQEIADQWRKHSTSWGLYIANNQAWYLMGDDYLPPDTGSRTYNEHWYSIDSQITTEVLGAVCPGLVQSAIDLTGKFAHITNTGFPVHAAQFYAAMYANAFFEDSNDPNMVSMVKEALMAIPTTSRTHQVVTDVLDWYLEDINDADPNWRDTRAEIYNKYQGAGSYGRHCYWIESTVNTAATTLAILYGQGDFKETVQIGVLAGWDCDCNPATAGGLIGIIKGYCGLPQDLLTDPNDPNMLCSNVYKNKYRPYLPDPQLYRPQFDTITNIASRLTNLAEQNIIAHEGYITFDPNKTYHIPDSDIIVPEPEKPDPNGPAGLVAEALAAGITVTPTAAVQHYNISKDQENLYAIIDGITDNSYNGHKAYYSYIADPNARPELDFYQLNFSQPVKFNTLTFYEGDIYWSGINIYYRNDDAEGGFFNDLTVEILRDGRFITPANLQSSTALDRYKMYQVIDFNFAPTVGDAIRIIGTAGGTKSYTTIMELEAQGNIDPGLYVASVEIVDGQAQRSNVSNIAVTFSNNVTVTTDDVELTGTTNGTTFDANQINFSYNDESCQLTLEFDMDNDKEFGDSLPNDTYCLKLDCDSITDDGQNLLDDDRDPEDGFYTIEFHRLFGDADGSAAVTLQDFTILALHWLDAPADTGLDTNADNLINFLDLSALIENWLSEL